MVIYGNIWVSHDVQFQQDIIIDLNFRYIFHRLIWNKASKKHQNMKLFELDNNFSHIFIHTEGVIRSNYH